ncbi:hypothetical protein AUP68_04135 [Ilyonectria robusta]
MGRDNRSRSHYPGPQRVVYNTKTYQATITTEWRPLPNPMSRQDARLEQHKEGHLITNHRSGPRNPPVSHLSSTKATCSSDGKVHGCFGVAAGLSIRQQSVNAFR